MTNSSDKQASGHVPKPGLESPSLTPESVGPQGLVKTLFYCVLFLATIAAGFLWRDRLVEGARDLLPAASEGQQIRYWTSPHDPSFRSDKPGKDTMGMDLVPVYTGQQVSHGPTVIDPVLTERDYATVPVEKGPLVRTIHTVGTIEYVEPLMGDVTLKIDGWLEKLHVDYEGQPVHRGDPLFDLYSPELVATQQDLLINLQALQQAQQSGNAAVVESAQQNVGMVRQRLRFWDVTEQQIDDLARTGKVHKALTFYSPFNGIVIEKHAFEGKFLSAGQLLYRVADLSKVWAYVFVYQNQIHCVYEGQGATLRLANLPGHTFQGKVVYVYPYLDPKNRAVKVRLEFDNPGLVLKPGMFADILLEPHKMGTGIKIPYTAILQTGDRSLVYMSEPGNKFRAQEVTTGMELDGGMTSILTGLEEGQRIVAAPSFLMDSESRLRAVNRRFGPAPKWTEQMPPTQMPGMQMPGMKHGKPMPAVKHEEPMKEMKPGQPMPGMEHKKPMPGMKHEEPMPGMDDEEPMPGMEHPMPATKGSQP